MRCWCRSRSTPAPCWRKGRCQPAADGWNLQPRPFLRHRPDDLHRHGLYLIDDILAKVDRASMSTSLEVRCPLLDYRIIEMSWRFPTGAKCHDGTGKLPLRALLYRHVPRELVDRPKMGFGAPVEVWLRNELREWAEALMSREALGRHGLLNVTACRRLWEDFAHHNRGWNRVIWNILMFQAWHEAMRSVEATRSPLMAA
ncbi:asparagine synthase-related protein [Pseudoroseomonas wenyumeiae]